MLEPGTKLLVCHRELFAEDWPRLFVGELTAFEHSLARVHGYSFTRDPNTGFFERKDEPRTKVVSLSSGALIVYELPATVVVEDVEIDHGYTKRVVLRDSTGFRMDLSSRT